MNSVTSVNEIPENEAGKALDIEYIQKTKSLQEAVAVFKMACSRLFKPSLWQHLAGTGTASFTTQHADSYEIKEIVSLNDFLKIDIPGPGPAAGEGFDWVRVEAMQENSIEGADESFLMRLRACANPLRPEEGTAHFFTEEATSTFILKRNGNTISISYHGRNEKPNTADVNTLDKIRNGIVANSAIAGLSDLQWKALLQGILKTENGI